MLNGWVGGGVKATKQTLRKKWAKTRRMKSKRMEREKKLVLMVASTIPFGSRTQLEQLLGLRCTLAGCSVMLAAAVTPSAPSRRAMILKPN